MFTALSFCSSARKYFLVCNNNPLCIMSWLMLPSREQGLAASDAWAGRGDGAPWCQHWGQWCLDTVSAGHQERLNSHTFPRYSTEDWWEQDREARVRSLWHGIMMRRGWQQLAGTVDTLGTLDTAEIRTWSLSSLEISLIFVILRPCLPPGHSILVSPRPAEGD